MYETSEAAQPASASAPSMACLIMACTEITGSATSAPSRAWTAWGLKVAPDLFATMTGRPVR